MKILFYFNLGSKCFTINDDQLFLFYLNVPLWFPIIHHYFFQSQIKLNYLKPFSLELSTYYHVIDFKKSSIYSRCYFHHWNWIFIVGQNIMKPTQCTSIHQRFSNDIKSATKGIVFWEVSTWQSNKQTKLLSFIKGLVIWWFEYWIFNWRFFTL
jgi:hypothetical protein